MFWMAIPYFELSPEYICNRIEESGNLVTVPCTRQQVCENNDYISYSIAQSTLSLNNWMQQIGLQCSQPKYVGLIGSFSFVGSTIGCIVLPYIADKIGRLPVYFGTQFLQIPVFIAAIYATSISAIYIVSFFMGLLLVGKMTVGFVLYMELLPERSKVSKGILIMAGFPVAQLLATFILVCFTRDTAVLL
jgi:MFS family permease